MLDIVRNKQKSIIIKLAFAIIILSFVIGYAMLTSPGGPGGQDASAEAATVNGRQISYGAFQDTYSNLYQLYQNVYKEQFTPALEKQLKLSQKAIDSLIDQATLSEEAEQLGIEVSEKELVEEIAQIPAFQLNGVFDKEQYLQVLSYQRMTSDEFEQIKRNELRLDKVRQRIEESVSVSDADVEQEFRDNNEKVNLAYISLTPAAFEKKVKLDEEALKAYFAENQETFRIPEQVALRYLQFVPQRYQNEVTFDDEELQRFYRRNIDQFEILERVKASHILVKVDADASDSVRARKRAYADKLLAELKAGKDFAELARSASDDKASAVNGGSLGTFSRGSMVKPFEDAAFKLKPGELSDIVETTFGYHIIKVEEHTEPGVRSFEDAVAEVKEGLRAAKAKQLAYEKAMDAYNINRKTGDLEAAAKANELGVKETGPFASDGYIDGIGRNKEIIAAAMQLSEGTLARPVVTDDGVILFGLKQRIPSYIPELAEVRELVTAAYRSVEAGKLARAAAEAAATALGDGSKLSKLAGRLGYKIEETGEFTRAYSPFVPRLGSSKELAEAAFELTADKRSPGKVFDIQGRFVVVELKERIAADMSKLDDAKRAELKEALLSKRKDKAFKEHLADLRAKATITIAPRVQAQIDKENR
jgi:peptidyl-prolyl cis-trans isomerase D